MRTLPRSFTAFALLVVVASTEAQSRYAVAGITDDRQVEAFLSELQRASREDDRAALAAMIHFPAVVTIEGLRIPFADASALLERIDEVFTPALRSSISRAATGGAAGPGLELIRATEDGLWIGGDALRIIVVRGRLGIAAIVVPAGGPLEASLASSSEPLEKRTPRRIAIRVGPRPTQVAGLLAPGATDAFVVWVNRGQRLEVRLERVPMGVAAIKVVNAGTGRALNQSAAESARSVSGRVLEGADYRIEVRRLGTREPGSLPYVLSVSLR